MNFQDCNLSTQNTRSSESIIKLMEENFLFKFFQKGGY